MARLPDRLRGAVGWLGRLPLAALLTLGVLAAAGLGVGIWQAYRTYDFVQHDNSFCLQCHLMVEPYERFARSNHRDLGCKACHQPSLRERSGMALTQIIENPDEIGVHAEVPNEVCADCHVLGDPERWQIVANSAGHRVHLESEDPALEGLTCVECHSTSVHEFAASDRTCAQSGCHEDSGIQLGAMSNLAIHCAACHGFSVPVEVGVAQAGEAAAGGGETGPGSGQREAIRSALAPDEETCLSCHAMRLMVDLPDPDPHGGVCADCHDPHRQETPERAVESCTSAGCHADPQSLTSFHVGLDAGVLAGCGTCHQAHDFTVDGSNCLACHTEILDGGGAPASVGEAGALGSSASTGSGAFTGSALASLAMLRHGGTADAAGFSSSSGVAQQEPTAFSHSVHQELDCASCHASEERHGGLTVTTTQDCRSCHHASPVADDCASCHDGSATEGDPYGVVREIALSLGDPVRRTLPFDHEDHAAQTCATCHTEGLELSAGPVDCASCHAEHHVLDNDCSSCHVDAPDEAHPIAVVHVTCSGAGCHEAVPFEGVPRTRTVCLVCHQDMADHRPGGDCAQCHVMPESAGGAHEW